jgi:hypothetical protein
MPTWAEFAQLLGALALLGNCIISWRSLAASTTNGKKLDKVHETTNSLAQRNEAIAEELGIRKGIEQQKAHDR